MKKREKKKTQETKIFLWVCNQRKNVRCSFTQLQRVILMYVEDISLKASHKDQEESELIDCY